MPYANSGGPDLHAHSCSLICTLSDQPVRMRRLIWACFVGKIHKGPFLALRINYDNVMAYIRISSKKRA